MPKRKNPDTSKEAYNSLDPSQLAEIYQKILYALSQIGEGTFEDIAQALRIEKSRVWKRLSELSKADLIYRPGNKKPLKSGRLGYTWRLTDKSLPKTSVAERALKGKAVVDYSRKLIKKKTTQNDKLIGNPLF